jgi:nitrite reductase/ring-hydroxylating ferredoxin subunit
MTVPMHRAAVTEDIPAGQTHFCCVAGRPIVIANFRGRFYALDGICAHRGNPLEGARLLDHLIACPWHNFQYDVRTGRNCFPRNIYPADNPELQAQLQPLATHRIELRGLEIWVELE